jgi:hypothetical protein
MKAATCSALAVLLVSAAGPVLRSLTHMRVVLQMCRHSVSLVAAQHSQQCTIASCPHLNLPLNPARDSARLLCSLLALLAADSSEDAKPPMRLLSTVTSSGLCSRKAGEAGSLGGGARIR